MPRKSLEVAKLHGRQGSAVSWRRDLLFLSLGLATSMIGLAEKSMAEEPWHYTLDKPIIDQQGNFCLDEDDVLKIAAIFAEQGPRPGFAAVSQSDRCALRTQSFTPEDIITQVTLGSGTSTEYTISFVKVRTSGGQTEYLVTTRDIRRPTQ